MSARRVGYLGPEGTFTEEALRAALADDATLEAVPLGSVDDVVSAVQQGRLSLGVVPLENALEGSVTATLDALVHDAPNVAIVREVVHPIRHVLAVRAGTAAGLADIAEVHSHPQAIAQCRRWLRATLPAARLVAAPSTAAAMRALADGIGDGAGDEPAGRRAAIGPRLAAERYGAQILAGLDGELADHPENATRFAFLGRAGTTAGRDAADPRPWRTSLACRLIADRAGVLAAILTAFGAQGVSFLKIESRPTREAMGSYLIFLDCPGAATDEPIRRGIAAVEAGDLAAVRILGSFPVG